MNKTEDNDSKRVSFKRIEPLNFSLDDITFSIIKPDGKKWRYSTDGEVYELTLETETGENIEAIKIKDASYLLLYDQEKRIMLTKRRDSDNLEKIVMREIANLMS